MLVGVGVLVGVAVVGVLVAVLVGVLAFGVLVGVLVGVGVAVVVVVSVSVAVGVTGVLVAVLVGVGVAVVADCVMVKFVFEMSKKILVAQAICTRAVVVAIFGAVTLAVPLLATPVAKVVG